ncbi:TIGR04282 family arsenosugar biosynthesis glycosyltransferase [Pseudodesulfovibrio portus]|uniref:Glycosyltransferase n=1 Tax=Pseudodesulfovibrio portus TaxID=231439 RepID=A0ABM8AUG3_9BACT|nr:TIGR04282 family arsenosugar biosynthesis glycosyltransferase [Pseudodesulfovibrio portus]BDQ35127.1 hypothetical protein JCM14722_26690 [Pseudodesulfovibrio portus]
MNKNCVLFFIKYPEPGRVKTRLAEESTPEQAAAFYRAFVEEKLAELEAGVDGDVVVFFTPESRRDAVRDWLGKGRRYVAQKGADLGRRMENGFREAFFMGYQRGVLVGSDIPGLSPGIVNLGLRCLEPDRASLGPAGDGGYYLIGFHRTGFSPEVFRTGEWSTPGVYERAFNVLAGTGLAFTELERLDDMDTMEDVETMLALGELGPLKGRTLEMARKLVGK